MAKRVVILVAEEVQDQEWIGPKYVGEFLGWEMRVAAPSGTGCFGKYKIPVKTPLATHALRAADWDAVIIAGGWGAERLRRDPETIRFVKEMHRACKPIAAICHGPWVLVSAGLCKGLRMTCYSGMMDDAVNAGGCYAEEPVVSHGTTVTSPHYDHVPAFMKALAELLT